MIGTIRKHSKWLWGLVITATIISFVYFFTPTAGNQGYSGRSGNYGSIDGVPITRDDYIRAERETILAYFLATGNWPGPDARRRGYDAEMETYRRLFLVQKLKDHNVHVDSAAVARTASDILRQLGRGQTVTYKDFVDKLLVPQRLSGDDFERYLRHELGLQQLIAVIGISGELVTPEYAESLYVRHHQELATRAVFFSGSNYLSSIPTPTPEELGEFYTNQAAAYRLPERVQVSYVSFPVSNYLDRAGQQITNLSEQVEFHFEQVGTNYLQLGETPELAKDRIRELLLERQAMLFAGHDADQFADVLFGLEPDPRSFVALAQTNGLDIKTTAPFTESSGPDEFDAGTAFAREAFSRTAEDPFGGPIVTEDGVYVIALDRTLPSEIPPLESLGDRVVEDYRNYRAAMLARNAGAEFARNASNGLAEGKSFDAIAAEAKQDVFPVPPISMASTNLPAAVEDHVSLYQYQRLAFETTPGEMSPFSPTREGGLIIYVEKRLPIDRAQVTAQMPAFLRAVRQARRQDAVNTWLQREASQSLQDTLLNQRRPPGEPAQGGPGPMDS